METIKSKWWVYVESGETVFTQTVDEAIARLQPFYRGYKLTTENVVAEDELFPVHPATL
jgi:hypothetical protein